MKVRTEMHGVRTLASALDRCIRNRHFWVVAVCYWAMALSKLPAAAAEPISRQLLPSGATAILEIRQPQIAFHHALVKRLLPIMEQSRAFQAAVGSPDLDLIRDSIQHFESELGMSLPQIVESCAGEGLLISATAEKSPQFAIVLTGHDADRVARLPEVTLSLARKIVAGRGQNLPDPLKKSHAGNTYYQFGEAFYAVVGPRWLLSNRESILQGMLDRVNSKESMEDTGLTKQLGENAANSPGIRLVADLAALNKLPGNGHPAKWPPKDIGQVVLAAGWLDLVLRSPVAVADIDLGGDTIAARVHFPAPPENLTPGTVGFFAAEPGTQAAPLLEPPQLIYSLSWYRDYTKMWDNRNLVPLPDQVKRLEMQVESVEKGNLGYSGFDMIRLIGPQHRIVVTRPGPNPYRVEMIDRLPAAALVLSVRDEKEFRERVLFPIQRILGIVAVTNKMVIQTTSHRNAEISALRFTEDPVAVQNSDRIRYNFEPSYTVTRGHLVVGSSTHVVRAVIDELDRLSNAASASSGHDQPRLTEQQILRLDELSHVLTDVHGLAVRNAVLNDGLTISEAESELNLLQQIISSIGQMKVHAGFGPTGFEYRLNFEMKATP